MSRTLVRGIFFPTCHELKTWFQLSRVKLSRNDLRGNKTYFVKAGGSLTEGSSYLESPVYVKKELNVT